MTVLNPYLSFESNAREAMEFYRSVFGGQLEVMTFEAMKDAPGMNVANDEAHLVMHAQLTTDEGLTLMGSDTPSHVGPYAPPRAFAVSISGDDEARLRGYWDGLADGAAITMPLSEAVWGGLFGMLTDRFGVDWMVSVNPTS